MAKYIQSEFARVCGITKGSLAVYIGRGKVLIEDGIIDDSKQINKDFRNRWQDKKGLITPKAAERINKNKIVTKDSGRVEEFKSDDDPEAGSLREIELKQKRLDVFKRAEEIKNLKIRNERLNGLVIPTDIVKVLFSQYSKSITVAFSNSVESMLILLAKKKGLNREEVAELRKEFKLAINEGVNDAINFSKKGIKNIVEEYSAKRGVGEKK